MGSKRLLYPKQPTKKMHRTILEKKESPVKSRTRFKPHLQLILRTPSFREMFFGPIFSLREEFFFADFSKVVEACFKKLLLNIVISTVQQQLIKREVQARNSLDHSYAKIELRRLLELLEERAKVRLPVCRFLFCSLLLLS
jgi:hypothetical protein